MTSVLFSERCLKRDSVASAPNRIVLGLGKSAPTVSTSSLLSGSGASWLLSGPEIARTIGFRLSAGCVHAATPIYGIAAYAFWERRLRSKSKTVDEGATSTVWVLRTYEPLSASAAKGNRWRELSGTMIRSVFWWYSLIGVSSSVKRRWASAKSTF